MRGGDSLMFWISRLNGVIWNICHSSNCIRQPTVRCPSSVFFGNRFRSADCQKIQLPLGGSRGEEAIRFYHSSNRSVSWAAGGFYPPLRVAAAEPPTGRLIVDPYRWRVPFNEPLSFAGFGRMLSAPTVWVGKLLPFGERLSCVHFGRLRASPTWRVRFCNRPANP